MAYTEQELANRLLKLLRDRSVIQGYSRMGGQSGATVTISTDNGVLQATAVGAFPPGECLAVRDPDTQEWFAYSAHAAQVTRSQTYRRQTRILKDENIVAYGAIDTSPASSTFNYDIVAIYSDWKRYKKVFSLDPDEFVLDIKLVGKKPYVLSRQSIGGKSSDILDHPWHFYSGAKASRRVFNWTSAFEGTGGVIGNSKALIYQQNESLFPNANFIQIKTLDSSFNEIGYFPLSGSDAYGATLLLDEVVVESSLLTFDGHSISLTDLESSFTTTLLTGQGGSDNQSHLRFAPDAGDEYFVSIKRFDPELFRFNAVTKAAISLGALSDRTSLTLSDTSIYRSVSKREYYLLAQQGDVGVYQFSGNMGSLKRLSDRPFVNLAVL